MEENVLEVRLTGTGGGGDDAPGSSTNTSTGGSRQHRSPSGPFGYQAPTPEEESARKSADRQRRSADRQTDRFFREEAARERRAAGEAKHKTLTAGFGMQAMMSGGGAANFAQGAMQLAGSGMLGEGAAALAGGPVGAAVMIGGMVVDKVAGLYRGATRFLEDSNSAAAQLHSSVIGNNAAEGLYQYTMNSKQQALDAIKSIPLVGELYASQLGLLAAPLTMPIDYVRGIHGAAMERANELAPLSGQIAAAQAEASVRETMADLREERFMGGDFAALIDATEDFKQEFRALAEPFKKIILQELVGFVRLGADMATLVREFLQLMPYTKKFFSAPEDDAGQAWAGLHAGLASLRNKLAGPGGPQAEVPPVPDAPAPPGLGQQLWDAATLKGWRR